jgi:hypothetical protein
VVDDRIGWGVCLESDWGKCKGGVIIRRGKKLLRMRTNVDDSTGCEASRANVCNCSDGLIGLKGN